MIFTRIDDREFPLESYLRGRIHTVQGHDFDIWQSLPVCDSC